MRASPPWRVAVVGGGFTGLMTAHRLVQTGACVSVFEAHEQAGGQVNTSVFSGCTVDLGAEALHTAAPEVLRLVLDLGLEDDLVEARSGPTWLWSGDNLRPLPAGVGPAGPSRLWPVAASRVLSARGLLRAACEPFIHAEPTEQDVGVGTFISRRFGPEVTARLVDPLLGGLHAADVGRLSLEATTPHLYTLAREGRSLLRARTRRPPHDPRFVSLRGGLGRLIEALASDPRLELRCATPVREVAPAGAGYRLEGSQGQLDEVDAVVLAVPATVGATLLHPLVPEAACVLDELRAATVATAVLAYPTAAVTAEMHAGTGLLVRSSAGRLLKAATFLSTKWPHLAANHRFLVRVSAGRVGERRVGDLDDDALVATLHGELAEATGLGAPPLEHRVQRWPGTMAQLETGHRRRMERARSALHPALALAGAPYDGIGLASCIRSATHAADRLLAHHRAAAA